MEVIFTAKFKILYIIIASCAIFAYFKYVKKDTLSPYVSLAIGIVFLAVGMIATNIFYSPAVVVESLLLKSDINWGAEKMFFMSYCFLLYSFMSFIEMKIFKRI